MAELTGVSGKQAYDVVGGETPKAYLLIKIKEWLSLLSGEDPDSNTLMVETRGASINILTATTTVVATGGGHLNNLIAVGGTMGNVTVYDNTAASGTVLWGPGQPTAGARILEDVDFAIGLTVVTAAASFLSGSVR